MLTVRNLSVSLSGKPVLAGITAEAAPRKVTAIIGPNGSGKTTLLRAVSGDLPHRRPIGLNGKDCAALRP
ncbi:MAG: ATP-binding cassette domain-containing protein [Gemmobacter sp.]